MSEDVKKTDENSPGEESETDENPSAEVIRSTGAQGSSQSPLLASLLQETLRHAEVEKENIDAQIREKETEARRAKESEAAVRRAELQRKVEAEQERRQSMLRGQPGIADTQTEAESEGPVRGGVEKRLRLLFWVVLSALVLTLGFFYMQAVSDRDTANAAQSVVENRLADLNKRVSHALAHSHEKEKKSKEGDASALSVIQALSDRFEDAVEEKEAAAARIQQIEASNTEIQAALNKEKARADQLSQELDGKASEITDLQAQLEEALSSRGKKRSKGKKRKAEGTDSNGKKKSGVKKTKELFGSGQD